jgi:hypothetical protein
MNHICNGYYFLFSNGCRYLYIQLHQGTVNHLQSKSICGVTSMSGLIYVYLFFYIKMWLMLSLYCINFQCIQSVWSNKIFSLDLTGLDLHFSYISRRITVN